MLIGIINPYNSYIFAVYVVSDVITVSPENHINASIHNKHDGIAYVVHLLDECWIRDDAWLKWDTHIHIHIRKKKIHNAHIHSQFFFSWLKSYWVWMWMRTCHRNGKHIIAILFYTWTLKLKQNTPCTLCERVYVLHCCDIGTWASKISNAIVSSIPISSIESIRNSLGNICILINYYWWRYVNSNSHSIKFINIKHSIAYG